MSAIVYFEVIWELLVFAPFAEYHFHALGCTRSRRGRAEAAGLRPSPSLGRYSAKDPLRKMPPGGGAVVRIVVGDLESSPSTNVDRIDLFVDSIEAHMGDLPTIRRVVRIVVVRLVGGDSERSPPVALIV